MASPSTLERVKTVIRVSLRLDAGTPLDDRMLLIGGEYDLDSLDILLVVTNIEKEFAIRIPDRRVGREAFKDIVALADFVEAQKAAERGPQPPSFAVGDPSALP